MAIIMGGISPIGAGISALLGAGAGAIGGLLLGGGGKKEQTVAQVQQAQPSLYAPYTVEPYATYAPTITKTYQPTYNPQLDYLYAPSIRIASPGETTTIQETKKESAIAPSVTVIPTVSPTYTQTPTQTTRQEQKAEQMQLDTGGIISMLIIGGIALGGIYLITKRKKK